MTTSSAGRRFSTGQLVAIALAIFSFGLAIYLIDAWLDRPAVSTRPLAAGGESRITDLPSLPDAERWELIWGLNAKVIDTPPVVSGQTPLRLTAVPTQDEAAQDRHAVMQVLTGLNPGGAYRVTIWVKAANTNIQLQIHDSVDAKTGEPPNDGEVHFDFKADSTPVVYGNLLAHGIATTTEGWKKAWVDLKNADGVVYVYLGLLEQGGSSHAFTGSGEQFWLGGIEADPTS